MRNTAKNENNTAAKGKTAEKETSFSKSILKTLSILEQYSKADELGIKELSESTGIPASTVQRIVNTLVMKQYLVQNPHTLKYQLGIAFFNISSRYSNSRDWVEVAKAHMEEQVEKTQETVNLAILQGKSVIYLTKVDSPHILRPNFTVGTAYPALNTALGRCLLAYQPWDKVERMIRLQRILIKISTNFMKCWKKLSGMAMRQRMKSFSLDFFASLPRYGTRMTVLSRQSARVSLR